jgi:type I restriction enzyme M protein
VDEHIVYGVISMPSNVFASTGTNVSVLFLDNSKKSENVVLIDASKLGEDYKDGNITKHRLSEEEINKIVNTFLNKTAVDDFSVVVNYDEIKSKNCSLSAGQYFDVKIEYVDITAEEFERRMIEHKTALSTMFSESHQLEQDILSNLENLKFEE